MFYLSEYLEANRDEYYERFKAISAEDDWNGRIAFFLKAITQQAKTNSQRVRDIMELYRHMKHRIQDITHSQYTVHPLDAIFSRPIFRTTDVVAELEKAYGIHPKTTPSLLQRLKDAGVLLEIQPASGGRAAVLYFPQLIALAEGRDLFDRETGSKSS